MSIFSTNPFDLLDSNDKPAAAPAKAPKVAASGEVNATLPEQTKENRNAKTGGRHNPRGRGRGRGNPRSSAGTYQGGDRPRREKGGARPFDRHSQTARTDSEKQVSAGWGAPKDAQGELADEEAAAKDAAADVTVPATPAEPVEEDNSQTYEEYLASLTSKKLNIELPAARAPEVADESELANAITHRKEDQVEEWYAGEQNVAASKTSRQKKQKEFLPIQVTYSSSSADRPPRDAARPTRGSGRGGRGGARGGRGGAKAPRGGASTAAPRSTRPKIDINDNTAFPTLS